MTFLDLMSLVGENVSTITAETHFHGICSDSRQCNSGQLFIAFSDRNLNYVQEAIQNGASAVLVRNGFQGLAEIPDGIGLIIAGIKPFDFETAVWKISHAELDYPTRKLNLVGVTGTNGKTTTAWFAAQIFNKIQVKSAYYGTLGYYDFTQWKETLNTTPIASEVASQFAESVQNGITAVAMEVSSHALAEKRADGCEFDAVGFTNLTQDHLDFHGSMAGYEATKLRLFTELRSQSQKRCTAVINVDDPVGKKWAASLGSPIITYSPSGRSDADLSAEIIQIGISSLTLKIRHKNEITEPMQFKFGGVFNVENLLCAVGLLIGSGYLLESIKNGMNDLRAAPGRFESIDNDQGFYVLVDYAHTPDALMKLLDSVIALKPNRIITVFGSGGDRDKTKRPLMAKAASERSDYTIITSDNPRTEDPLSIIEDVQLGLQPNRDFLIEPDREAAIRKAISIANAGDVVVLAGKGHENYQIIGKEKLPFDDREMARKTLNGLAVGRDN